MSVKTKKSEKRTESLDDQKASQEKKVAVRLEKSDVEEVAGGARRSPIVTPEI